MMKMINRASVTIRSGEAVSDPLNLGGLTLAVLDMSALWTAADLTFAGSGDNYNWYFIYKEDGTLLQIPTNESHRIILPSSYLSKHKSIKICSGTHDVPVYQGADRIIFLELWE